MNKNMDKAQVQPVPPRLMTSFVSGFNAVANHIYLLILPVALDLLLWFGPHMSLKDLLYPLVLSFIQTVRESGSAQSQTLIVGVEEIWKTFLDRFNLLSSISTYPLGIPSLISGQSPIKTPLGTPETIQIHSPMVLPIAWLLFLAIGFMLGSVYLSGIARACLPAGAKQDLSARVRLQAWQTSQLLFLVVFLVLLLAVLALPTLLISLVLLKFSSALASITLTLMGLLTIWFIVPLVFSPHGIFVLQQNAFTSALNSARLVRFFLPGTGLFLLVAVVLNQGMDVLWRSPDETSWMVLIGIAGHAFISTGLLAASFFYYLDGLHFIQSLRRPAPVPGA